MLVGVGYGRPCIDQMASRPLKKKNFTPLGVYIEKLKVDLSFPRLPEPLVPGTNPYLLNPTAIRTSSSEKPGNRTTDRLLVRQVA